MSVEITRATSADTTLLRNLYPLYLHDLTSFYDFYEINEQGVFQPDYLDFWLSERSDTHKLVIRIDGRPAGFALIGQAPFPYMSPERDFQMAEFFVLRKFRRRGVGRAAALAILDMFRGRWEITEVRANAPAITFWRNVIGAFTGGKFEEIEIDGNPTQVFSSVEPQAAR
ncbi:GNAT family N-acetyltransferase [Polyangium sp. 6x1]|uniref:GNAT family N-acetyltransferase n=1 Tax=Polyangium sp. 6x1 TaxID=3042689 RepID=UPI002482A33D|nr:GNAT family N-acetyltransferase [Polyangium sp. 6x1]MDI1443024.1 GNAT family N-acetyltransferase [Polyangium sp. 6x1]